jgi:hypothetical protein
MSVTFEVDHFEAAVRHLPDRDVPFFLGPTETKVCHWAAFCDPDGNRRVIPGEVNRMVQCDGGDAVIA